jgi:hypothetical protein
VAEITDHRHETIGRGRHARTVCCCPILNCEWRGSHGALRAHIYQWHELRSEPSAPVIEQCPEPVKTRRCVRLNRVCKTHHQLWPCRSGEPALDE